MATGLKNLLTKQEIESKIQTEEDFIDYPKFNNSIKKLLSKHENGIKNETIAKVLHITTEEVEETFQIAVRKLKKLMKIGN